MQVLQHEQMAVAEPVAERPALERICDAYHEFNATGEVPLELFDPAVEYEQPDFVIGTDTYYGHDGLRQALREMLSSFDTFEMLPTDLVYDCGDSIVIRVQVTARGKGSGAEVGGRIFHVWTMRGNKVVRGRVFLERAEAIDAVLAETRLPAAA
jgi:ketosteroid isomerase-like protein